MEFTNRQSKCKKIQKTDVDGVPVAEAFYALITDELELDGNSLPVEGTPLNDVTFNELLESIPRGAFGFQVIDGELILNYSDNNAPNLTVINGDLIYSY